MSNQLANALALGNIPVGQVRVSVTGTAVQFPSYSLTNGVVVTNNGSTTCTVGNSNVTNTADGTGNGAVIAPGASTSFAANNTNQLWLNGTSTTSWISFSGS